MDQADIAWEIWTTLKQQLLTRCDNVILNSTRHPCLDNSINTINAVYKVIQMMKCSFQPYTEVICFLSSAERDHCISRVQFCSLAV